MNKFRVYDNRAKQILERPIIVFQDNVISVSSNENSVIDDYVLMQSTGLSDKNGKEIFEGDVVNIQFVAWDFEGETEKEYKNAAIYFDTYGSQLTVPSFYIKDEYGVRLLSELPFYDENIEVIGNIYEHPDLLEKENEE